MHSMKWETNGGTLLMAANNLCYKPRVAPATITLIARERQLQLPIQPKGLVRPPLKWAGGKRWLLPKLKEYWETESHRRLVEPFCGGLAVTLGLMPERALLNDINPHLINFYQWLKRGLRIDIRLENKSTLFYTHRARFNELLRDGQERGREAAELFYFLNRTGYNGLCRFNSRGEFNVPFGQYERIAYAKDFTTYCQPFASWQFSSVGFERLALQPDDFVYADPPYDVEFTKYSKE